MVLPDDLSRPDDETDDEVVVFQATPAQRRFWLLDQLVPGGNPALNMPLAIRLRGTLDPDVLARSVNEIIRRHEALRTTFHSEKGRLLQMISPSLTIKVTTMDATDFPPEQRAQVPAHILAEEARQPFDLAKGPLLRARLVRLAPHDHLFICPTHHIVADGWSNGVFVRELGALYTAGVAGKRAPLGELPMHFADFAQWQTGLLDTGGFDAQLAYWRAKLSGDLPVLDLPTSHPRTPWRGQAAQAEIAVRPLSAVLVGDLKSLAARQGCSMFMLTLAAFGVLLGRYTGGQEDLLVATSTANRPREELENVIGLFVNPLLLRLDLAGAATFGEVLDRVRSVVLEAFENSDVPFEKLLEELQPRRLQVNFLCQQDFVRAERWGDLEMTAEEPGSGGAVYEWNVIVLEDAAGLRLHCEYNTELFDAASIDRVLADYEALLAAVAAPGGLDKAVARLPLVVSSVGTASEETSLLVDWWRLSDTSLPWLREHFAASSAWATGPCRPLPGRRLLVLDGGDETAPVNVPGELCIAVGSNGDEIVKTGDIAVRREDGVVVWIGPSGTECKVNGLRVDRRQIETALLSHPHVTRAVVLWRDDENDRPLLATYYAGDGAPAALLSAAEIRGFLQDHLPDDWVPEACILVKDFALTPDGRLNVDALPLPVARPQLVKPDGHDVPYLPLHHEIIQIWREVLNVRSVNIRDDFFALGGNSLSAMRMLYRLEQAFGKALLPATLFQCATVEHLADEILKNDGEIGSREIVRIQEQGSRTPIFYLHGDISGGGFYCIKLARDLGADQPFYALPPYEVDQPLVDRPTIEEMAAFHVATIRSVRPHGPYVVGGFCVGGVVAYEVACQLQRLGETVEKLLVIDAGPVYRRYALIRLGVEILARLRGLDKNRQLYLFCRWHHWLARWERFCGLSRGERGSALARRWRNLFRRGPALPPEPTHERVEESPTGWFNARLDVPLVFLWALGRYQAKPYQGELALLLSTDVIEGDEGGNPTAAWRRLVPKVEVIELVGNHLACITEHVSELAAAVRRCLKL